MKAAIFQGPGFIHTIEEVAIPSPGPHQVLIKVERCGVCGSDITMGKARSGPNPMGASYDAIFFPGAVLGHEIGGSVVELGADVTRLKVGDRIAPMAISGCSTCAICQLGNPVWCGSAQMFMGGYGQYALANENFCARLPSDLTMDSGALVEPMATSLHAVALAQIPPNARVVVIGAGAVGLGIVRFARQVGAGMIAAVARSPLRETLALSMGADLYMTQRPTLAEELADAMGGPADVVFEAAGASGIIAQAIACVRPRGKIIIAGISIEPEAPFHAAAIQKEAQLQYATAYTRSDFEVVVRLLRDPTCSLGQLVSDTVSLQDFPAKFDALCKGAHHIKVLLDPWKQ